MELWPAGLQTPTVYYMCRERQLAYQIRLVEATGGAGSWRPPLPGRPAVAELLQQRALPSLVINVPIGTTGVEAADACVIYTGSVAVNWCKPSPTSSAVQPAAAPASCAPTRTALPPAAQRLVAQYLMQEQPAKRSKLCSCNADHASKAAAVGVPLMAPAAASLYSHPLEAAAVAEPSSFNCAEGIPISGPQWLAPAVVSTVPAQAAAYSSTGTHMAACSAGVRSSRRNGGSSPLSVWIGRIRAMLSPAPRLDTALVF